MPRQRPSFVSASLHSMWRASIDRLFLVAHSALLSLPCRDLAILCQLLIPGARMHAVTHAAAGSPSLRALACLVTTTNPISPSLEAPPLIILSLLLLVAACLHLPVTLDDRHQHLRQHATNFFPPPPTPPQAASVIKDPLRESCFSFRKANRGWLFKAARDDVRDARKLCLEPCADGREACYKITGPCNETCGYCVR